MVNICDAIMGSGKSTAAINYMNEHPNDKFVYITPYLDEANRIYESCHKLRFVKPSNIFDEFKHKKIVHSQHLLDEGRNIATTHASFKFYTPEMIQIIKDKEYTLIIDESVDVLQKMKCHNDDFNLAVKAGYIKEDNGVYSIANDGYHGVALKEVFAMLRNRSLFRSEVECPNSAFCWVLSPELFTSFKDVFVLTYLFEGQSLYKFMKMYNIEYEKIGVSKSGDYYYFSKKDLYIPEYVHRLGDMITVHQDKTSYEAPHASKLNAVGDKYHSLSVTWFKDSKNKSEIAQLKNNIYTYFRRYCDGCKSTDKLWSTFKCSHESLKGKGYTKSFLNFNAKATNAYMDRHFLAYVTNVFMNVDEKKLYNRLGVDLNEDMYSLSVLVQWIWRSAIRNGEHIHIYLPSRRMRCLLYDWIESLKKGGGNGCITADGM